MSNNNYFIYINLDGFGKHYFDIANSMFKGTPNLNYLIKNGVLFKNVYTGIPSITFPMQSSILSGAYSEITSNCYEYYDINENKLIKCGHSNKGETLGEVLRSIDESFISLQQFALRDKGCNYDNEKYLYLQPGGNYKKRFDLFMDILKGKKVKSKDKEYCFKELPHWFFIYVDDLDAIGHNPVFTNYAPFRVKAFNEKMRIKAVVKRLIEIDKKIGQIIQLLKEKNIFHKTDIVITSDHGMVPYKGKSSMGLLVEKFKALGFTKVALVKDLVENPWRDNSWEVALNSTGIQCQVYFNKKHMDFKFIQGELLKENYIEYCLTREELDSRGVCSKFAHMLISPKPPLHFNTDLHKKFSLNGSHDSLNNNSQKVFGLMTGPNFKSGIIYEENIYNIDFMPTVCRAYGIPMMKGYKGNILEEILI